MDAMSGLAAWLPWLPKATGSVLAPSWAGSCLFGCPACGQEQRSTVLLAGCWCAQVDNIGRVHQQVWIVQEYCRGSFHDALKRGLLRTPEGAPNMHAILLSAQEIAGAGGRGSRCAGPALGATPSKGAAGRQ